MIPTMAWAWLINVFVLSLDLWKITNSKPLRHEMKEIVFDMSWLYCSIKIIILLFVCNMRSMLLLHFFFGWISSHLLHGILLWVKQSKRPNILFLIHKWQIIIMKDIKWFMRYLIVLQYFIFLCSRMPLASFGIFSPNYHQNKQTHMISMWCA